jgi:hypothetical protein
MPNQKPFQRLGADSNAQVGRHFEAVAQRRDHQAAQVERAALKRELHAAKWDKRTRTTVFGKPTWQHRPRKGKKT